MPTNLCEQCKNAGEPCQTCDDFDNWEPSVMIPGEGEQMSDNVNSPAHYTQGNIECINAIAAAVEGYDGMDAVCTGHIIRYVWRWKRKNGIEDLKKARWYIDWLINRGVE